MPIITDIRYKQPNRRKCYYWLVKECLLGKSPCSYSCPGYLSVAQAEKKRQERLKEKIRD
jgi:hypothetical protein